MIRSALCVPSWHHFVPTVPLLPLGVKRQIAQEVQRHGAGETFDNRAGQMQMHEAKGDEEFAQQAKREAQYILDVYA